MKQYYDYEQNILYTKSSNAMQLVGDITVIEIKDDESDIAAIKFNLGLTVDYETETSIKYVTTEKDINNSNRKLLIVDDTVVINMNNLANSINSDLSNRFLIFTREKIDWLTAPYNKAKLVYSDNKFKLDYTTNTDEENDNAIKRIILDLNSKRYVEGLKAGLMFGHMEERERILRIIIRDMIDQRKHRNEILEFAIIKLNIRTEDVLQIYNEITESQKPKQMEKVFDEASRVE